MNALLEIESDATDATGNWSSVTTNGTAQDREHDAANETTSADGWASLGYDEAGNTITLRARPF